MDINVNIQDWTKDHLTMKCSPPVAIDFNGWTCLKYDIDITKKDTNSVVYNGVYHIGIGHIDTSRSKMYRAKMLWTANEEQIYYAWVKKPHAKFIDQESFRSMLTKLALSCKTQPCLTDVFMSLHSDSYVYRNHMAFDEFCNEYGYSNDSISAKDTYDKVIDIGRSFSRAFSDEEIKYLDLVEW